ncbi:MAG: PD40 domain-containing protein [Actinobacteria bacterium]|nr:PD40 domain-containing protein [Actinomycetota bacterium]
MAIVTDNGYNVRVRAYILRPVLRLAVALFAVGVLLSLPASGADAAFPGTNGLIAFERGSDIYTVTTGSTPVVSSTALVANASDPSWSPNGNKLAFTQSGSVKVLTVDGGAIQTLDTGSAPTWSPDGTMIAYERSTDIYVISSSGGTGRNLSNSGGSAADDDPAWSPDGDSIAFTRTAANADIYTMDAPSDPATGGGGNQAQLTTATTNETQPSYDPDGGVIAFASDRIGVAQRQIYTISTSGGTETRVSSSTADDYAPAHAPDGTQIAFARTGAGIYTTGTGETPLTSGGTDTNPDWQPAAPTNTTLPVITGNFSDGGTMFASTGTFASASSYAYRWLRCDEDGDNCDEIEGADSSTYRGSSQDVGKRLRVRVTATSSSGSSSATSDPTPLIAGPEPQNVTPPRVIVPGLTGVPMAGVAQSSSVGFWTGEGPITYTYQWKKCQPKDGPCYRILETRAQSSTFVPTADLVGWSLRVEVTATNSAGSSTVQSESTPLVIANAPLNLVRPRISISTTNPTVGQELTADTGSFTGFGLSFTYQWRRCDPPGTLPSCVPIPGAVTSRYTTTEADLGVTLRVYVTATGLGGSTTQFSDHTFPTVPAPRLAPALTTAPLITGDAVPGETLTATRGAWTGFAPLRYSSAWQRCDATVTVCRSRAVKGLIYKVTAADLGFRIRFIVVARNSVGNARANSDATEPIVLGPRKPKGRTIVGTSRSEYIAGGGGDDILSGRGGNDTIRGGGGDDRLNGGDGNDYIDGGGDVDRIDGGAGSDTIIVADGEIDIVECGDGNDRVVADPSDRLSGCEAISFPPTTSAPGPEPPDPPDPPTP